MFWKIMSQSLMPLLVMVFLYMYMEHCPFLQGNKNKNIFGSTK